MSNKKSFVNSLVQIKRPDVQFSLDMERMYETQLDVLRSVWSFHFMTETLKRFKGDEKIVSNLRTDLVRCTEQGKSDLAIIEEATSSIVRALVKDPYRMEDKSFRLSMNNLASLVQSSINRAQTNHLAMVSEFATLIP